MVKLTALLVISLAVANVIGAPSRIDPSLKAILKFKATADIVISFKEGTASALSSFRQRIFSTRAERLTELGSVLKQNAAATQQHVLDFLNTKSSVTFTTFWISNQIFVKGANLELVESLGRFTEISDITEEEILELVEPIERKVSSGPSALAEWGVSIIEAPKAWAVGNIGEGAVVATIDTGVRYTHEALVGNYRAQRGWYDPYLFTETPNDQNGHGTHTTGTIAGQGGIGVAPGALWIACKGCATSDCALQQLIACGQFMVCPTNPDGTGEDCSAAPHLVSNSWGGGRGRDMYHAVIAAWKEAGIIPLFSNGNNGPSCNSANSPADHEDVLGVGSTTIDDALSSFSSVGPSVFQTMKPDISAPGSMITSAYNTSDNAYAVLSGTSMACPHVAGVVALLAGIEKDITFEKVKAHLNTGAEQQNLTKTGRNCDGQSEDIFPNHAFGHGRINAFRSVQTLMLVQ